MSVIVAPIGQSFRLQDLGDARSAAQRFLSTTVAPEGSDKEARLLRASERWLPAALDGPSQISGDSSATLFSRASLASQGSDKKARLLRASKK